MGSWENNGQSDEWYTPKYIFDALDTRFDLDVASPASGPKYVPCEKWIYEKSLEKDWIGFLWMNPPFGKRNGLEPWLDRFFEHGNGIALCPDRTSAPWFQKSAKKSSAMVFLSPKVKFEKPDATIGNSPGRGTVLMASGERAKNILLMNGKKLGFVVINAGSIE